MSQVSTTMAMTTTSPVTVVSSGMSSLSSVIMALSLMGLPTTLGQHNVVLPPPLTRRCSGGVLGHASVPQQQTSIFDASSGLWQLCHRLSTGRFLCQSWVSHHFVYYIFGALFCILYVWCLFWCLLSAFRCHAGCHVHLWGLNCWGLFHFNPLEFICGRHMCNLVMVIGLHQVCTECLFPPLHWVGWSLMLLHLLFPSHPIYMVGHTALGLGSESPNPSTFPAWWEGSFPGVVPSNDTIDSESVMGIKPGDSGVVIGYQVDEFTHYLVCRVICCLFPHLSWVHS